MTQSAVPSSSKLGYDIHELDQPGLQGGGLDGPTHELGTLVHQYDVLMRTRALIRGLDLVLKHHRASETIRRELDLQVSDYLGNSPNEKIWLTRAKYLLCRPLAEYLCNDLPKSPDSEYQWTGCFRKWFKTRLRIFNRKNTHLWYSWYQAKRASLPASESMIVDTYMTHFETLTKEDPGVDETINRIFQDRTFMSVLRTIKKRVDEGFKPGCDHFPSLNASFEASRNSGGQAGAIYASAGIKSDNLSVTELHSMNFHPVIYTDDGVLYNRVVEYRTFDGEEVWKSFWSNFTERQEYRELLEQGFIDDDGVKRSEPPPNRAACQGNTDLRNLSCTIQGVLEPFKVRVISKGEAEPYYWAKPLQKILHDTMRDMPCFRLIGRPFCPTDLFDLVKAPSKDQTKKKWFSIDYSAATDGLSMKYSNRILWYIIQDLDYEVVDNALQVLGPHHLYYPMGPKRVPLYYGLQKNGQLMGSILSFPILCLANLGVYLITTQDFQHGWKRSERLNSVLVNGDDMLYVAPIDYWEIHIKNGLDVGLQMSLGKSYYHDIYSNVNSTSCHFDLNDLDNSTPWRINFLNAGLYFGQHKVQGSDGTAEAHSVQSLSAVEAIPVLMDGCLPGRQCDLLRDYLIQRGEEIQKQTLIYVNRSPAHRNLFLPCSSGGMGVTAPPDWRFEVTSTQRLLSLEVKRFHPHDAKPLPGFEVYSSDTLVGCPWNSHRPGVLEEPIQQRYTLDLSYVPKVRVEDIIVPKYSYYVGHPNVLLVREDKPNIPHHFTDVYSLQEEIFVENYYKIISTWGSQV